MDDVATPPIDDARGADATARRALISGAGIAGLSAAYWLERTGWEVDVVERAPEFRDGGQNIDVRGIAREVVAKMGLDDEVRAMTTTEEGTAFVDDEGRIIGEFPAGEGDGPTAELEILRGDLAHLVLEACGPRTTVRHGIRISSVDDTSEQVTVTFDDGASVGYDLLVIAEGVRSSTRDLVFGTEVERHDLGLVMVYGTIDRIATDDRRWRWFFTDRRRHATLRPDAVGTTRATLAYIDRGSALAGLDRDAMMEVLRRVYDGAGWQTTRILDGFASSHDVYADDLTQIRMSTWSRGRVVVTGDAAWCVTPLGGGGASLALTGGYVLAAFLRQDAPTEQSAALRGFEEWMRPLVSDVQDLPKGMPGLVYPRTRVGVRALRLLVRAATAGPVRTFASRVGNVARSERALPPIEG